MNPVRRSWSLAELEAVRLGIEECRHVFLRLKAPASGTGKYLKETAALRQYAELSVEASPAQEFSVSFAHEWPRDVEHERVTDLDDALLRGLLEALARRCYLSAWGCSIRTVHAACGETTASLAVQLAASLAIETLLAKADWNPEPPPRKDVA
jgi:hypothetical protein